MLNNITESTAYPEAKIGLPIFSVLSAFSAIKKTKKQSSLNVFVFMSHTMCSPVYT